LCQKESEKSENALSVYNYTVRILCGFIKFW